jgi:hypothetical protein
MKSLRVLEVREVETRLVFMLEVRCGNLSKTKEEDGEMKLEHGRICNCGRGGVVAFIGEKIRSLSVFLEE